MKVGVGFFQNISNNVLQTSFYLQPRLISLNYPHIVGTGSGHHGDEFVDTGYGTHWGQGNVENDHVRHEQGTGFDVNTGQVSLHHLSSFEDSLLS
jgi:hypothetical protein